MELQLADNGLNYVPYIWVPNIQGGGGIYVRENKFDFMSEDEYDEFMEEIAPYQMDDLGLSENETVNLLAGFKSRRAERQQARKEKREAKADKKKSKTENRRGRAEARKIRVQGRADAKKTRADAKKVKAEGGGESEATGWMDKITDVAGKFIDRKKGGEEGGGDEGGGDEGGGETKKSNKTLWIVGGIAGALVLGTVIYVATKPKKVA